MKIQYNAPVILTFSILLVIIQFIDRFFIPGFTYTYFLVRPTLSLFEPLDYFRLFSHILGHSSWEHLFGNVTYILLLGPILEEKYGSMTLFLMIGFTALSTGVINVLLFSTGLLGASSIVFMLIILISIVDIKEEGTIPLTFIFVACIFIGRELLQVFRADHISQMAHLVGGTLGGLFGFTLKSSQ